MEKRCQYPCYQDFRMPIQKKISPSLPIRLIFFDMDGVLTDTVSSWRFIHDHYNTNNHLSVSEYLQGNIDDLEFIRRDIALWKNNGRPITVEHIHQILNKIQLMPGAQQLFSFLKEYRIQTAIISAGLEILAQRIAKKLHITHVYANGIISDEKGHLTGEGRLQVQLKYKDINILQLINQLEISPHQCAAIGNSCFDIPMLKACGIGIAFNPGDCCIKQAADIVVDSKNLSTLIPVLRPYLKY